MNIDEVIDECIEGLRGYALLDDNRGSHVELISGLLSDGSTSASVHRLLRKTAALFEREDKVDRLRRALNGRQEAQALVRELTNAYFGKPRWAYHGTLFGNLAAVLQVGLVPGKVPVWKNDEAIRQHSDTGVFFTDGWRQALNWAHMAARQSRMRGTNRRLVVFRAPLEELDLGTDTHAMADGNWVSERSVPAETLQVLSAVEGWVARWRPLSELSDDRAGGVQLSNLVGTFEVPL